MRNISRMIGFLVILLIGMSAGAILQKHFNTHNIVSADSDNVRQIFQCRIDSLTADIGMSRGYIDELHGQVYTLNKQLEAEKQKKTIKWFDVSITGYTASTDEGDGDPSRTATMTRPTPGRTVALSRDLFEKFKGQMIHIEGVGDFTVEDTMHPQYNNRIDILFKTKAEALEWGRKDFMRFRVIGPKKGRET